MMRKELGKQVVRVTDKLEFGGRKGLWLVEYVVLKSGMLWAMEVKRLWWKNPNFFSNGLCYFPWR